MFEALSSSAEKQDPRWIIPNFQQEGGELERVANTFAPDRVREFVDLYKKQIENARLVELDNELWNRLDNTESRAIDEGDWEQVNQFVVIGKPEGARNWRMLKERMEQGKELEAPIVVKIGDEYHLLSGNTRLCVARALGIRPQVVVVEMD